MLLENQLNDPLLEDISSLNTQIKEYDNQIEILTNAQKEMKDSNKLEKDNFYKITSQLIDSKKKLLEEMEDLEKHRKIFFIEKFERNDLMKNGYLDDNQFSLINRDNSPDGNNPLKSNTYFNSMQMGSNNERNFLNIKGSTKIKKNLNRSMNNEEKITLRVDNFEDNKNAKRQTPPKSNSRSNSNMNSSKPPTRNNSGRKD